MLAKLAEYGVIRCPTCDGSVEFDAEAWAKVPGTSPEATGETGDP
jgi:hypothetical protein